MGLWTIINGKALVSVGVVILERDWCSIYSGKINRQGEVRDLTQIETWSPAVYIQPDATRLFEEIVRKVKVSRRKFDALIVSMPGTIRGNTEIFTSSRLGIKKAFPASDFISKRLDNIRVGIIHDIDCMLFGALNVLSNNEEIQHETICYIVADEGVGSALMINGKIHHGAGVAGHISRLVLEDKGSYYQELAQAGTLESHVSRAWISHRCVDLYESRRSFLSNAERKTTFEKQMEMALNTNKRNELPFDVLAVGVYDNNSIANDCFDDAAKYLGKAISSIITICHPHKILIAGKLISEINGFYEKVIEAAKKTSWATAWNAVSFNKRNDSRVDQVHGSLILSMIENWGDVL